MNAILSHYLLGTSTSPQGFQFCISSDEIQERHWIWCNCELSIEWDWYYITPGRSICIGKSAIIIICSAISLVGRRYFPSVTMQKHQIREAIYCKIIVFRNCIHNCSIIRTFTMRSSKNCSIDTMI